MLYFLSIAGGASHLLSYSNTFFKNLIIISIFSDFDMYIIIKIINNYHFISLYFSLFLDFFDFSLFSDIYYYIDDSSYHQYYCERRKRCSTINDT